MATKNIKAPARAAASVARTYHPINMPVGEHGMVLVNLKTPPADRQSVASCILDTAVRISNDVGCRTDDDVQSAANAAWALCYLISIAKGLLDSLDVGETA